MNRKAVYFLALGIAILAAAAVCLFNNSAGVRPIEELDNVYYSTPDHWADFYENGAPEGIGWIHLPKKANHDFFKSASDPALMGFVEPHVCGECHADKHQSLLDTAHFRTSSEATRRTVLGGFCNETGRLETRDPDLRFEMVSEKGGLFQRLVVHKRGRSFEHAERFDIAIGSGNHGQTYLYWHGDELYQLPISYFSEAGGWINSPGLYRDGTADFARGIGHRCLDCHATYFAAAPGEDVRYDREHYVLGVTCVRCHGHGWAHVQYQRTHPDDKTARYIVQPGQLSRERANEVCAQCHSGVGDLLAPAFTYQPGEP